MSRKKLEIKLLLLGDSFVGKTTIFTCYTKGEGMTQPASTISTDFFYRDINLAGKDIKVKVYDPPGQKRYFNEFVRQYLRVDGIILVYDVTDKDSFSDIKELYAQVVSIVGNQIDFFIFGNKCDLKNKIVKENQVQEFSNDIDCDYYETTATNPSSIDIAFTKLIEKILKKKPDEKEIEPLSIVVAEPKKPSKCC
ncbi:hypothetical protein ACTFIY_003312 [Dictyostelium cf. discoideum]